MTIKATIDRAWIASEFVKLVDAERSLANDAKVRADSPPMPDLAVLYHEIADQDERHVAVLETIATRFGHTPTRTSGSHVGETLGRFKDSVVALGSTAMDLIRQDLLAKSDAISWQTAWLSVLESAEDSESVRDLTAVLAEDRVHQDALIEGLKRALDARAHEGAPI